MTVPGDCPHCVHPAAESEFSPSSGNLRLPDTPVQWRRSPSPTHVCFVSLTAYPLIAGREDLLHIGGAQVQQLLIARELVSRGHRVSFVVLDHGQPDGIEHDGVRAYKTCRRDAGLPAVRFVHPRWTSLWRALSRVDADVYYQRGAGAETGQVALWCEWAARPFLFAAACDADCDARLIYLPTRRERVLFRHGLRHASAVIAQTNRQAASLRASFGVEAAVVPGCSPDPFEPAALEPQLPQADEPRVLWVGRFHTWKRPEWLLDLAETMPDVIFDVVGAAPADPRARRLADRAARLTNVRMHGQVAHREMGRFYRQAGLLLCTSPVEGYPNTYLEAWALGRPVVGTVDPDDVVRRHRLGAVADSVPGLATAIRHLLSSSPAWLECSRNARRFFVENHTVRSAVDRFNRVLDDVVSARTTPRPRCGLLEKCNG